MNKNILHRISSFVLAVLILSASTGFTVDMHYCGGKMQSFSILGEADACTGMETKAVCTSTDHETQNDKRHCNLDKKKCCEDRMSYVQPIAEIKVSVNNYSVDLSDQAVIVLDIYDWSACLPIVDATTTLFQYRPPLLLRTTPVVLQSFLI